MLLARLALILVMASSLQGCKFLDELFGRSGSPPAPVAEVIPESIPTQAPTTEALPEPIVLLPDIIITWTAPEMREDSSPLSLSAIHGYNVYLGHNPGNYTDHQFTTDWFYIPIGYSYAVVTCVDIDRRESLYSEEYKIF